ncbi:MAG: class I SAM-dependent methyltransferase [Desulfurella sp.]|jgi:ubiquinone/menaquinone biosynthesis C-methylase UbiE|uniref:Methyltransferase domain-containing protein n=1 Tax=Desulfurella multipotens TaxID=79269 RepID=A0A1G6RCH6_9BACT|nr:class I SAM-dependent methyltransferase [Desulfurella multipotens]SDD02103.1 Methyltransferase domain-containing protein [Desulfurella multipotens]
MSKYASFVDIAENVFKDIYPQIAQNIFELFKKQSGTVVEIGCGSAILSRNLYNFGNFQIFAVDLEFDMAFSAKQFIEKENKKTILPIVSNVEALPFSSNFADLIISRGSMFFWENKDKGFREIYRILKKGGITYIGGGFGNKDLKEKIFKIMSEKNPNWHNQVKERLKQTNPEVIKNIMNNSNIKTYSIINDESGFWIIITKE